MVATILIIFSENQLTKSKLYLLTSLFLYPEDFCDLFCVAGSAFGRPCEISASILLPLSSASSPLPLAPSLLPLSLPQLSIPSCLFPFPLSLVPARALSALKSS